MTLVTEHFMIDPRWRLVFAVGFLGAYTTFSTYTYESFNLLFKRQWFPGLLNLFGRSILGIISVGHNKKIRRTGGFQVPPAGFEPAFWP
jgi:CrcB protein